MHNFPRPQQGRLYVNRQPIDGQCLRCGSIELAAYRALSEGGWWNVLKCQSCLYSISRTPASALGSFVPLGSTL